MLPSGAMGFGFSRLLRMQPSGAEGGIGSLAEQGFRGDAKEPTGEFWVTRKITLLLKLSKKNECGSDSLF
ncbi:hypothetical protein [uncultured Dysgonomonas sp.]|uniref:Uncharacterized protein n=1 Tax=uncultured Dysgonomonas sp. TaxID=206096 RepID=A0A212IVW1_9BACT|nr:hypothetical protein [uncultured Dysgonomonas sp.]SBV91351.1 hypothetical protein KL86DYS1_10319 [uncultured Dysgonomonas sp.]